MKKSTKFLTAALSAAALSAAAFSLAACGGNGGGNGGADDGKKTVEGEYHYNFYVEYGVKVKVSTDNGVITGVEVIDSDYVEYTSENDGWDDAQTYIDGKSQLLEAYVGKTVTEVMAITVAVDNKAPLTQEDEGFVSYDSDLILTGATQCSGRLLLAVQDALSKL